MTAVDEELDEPLPNLRGRETHDKDAVALECVRVNFWNGCGAHDLTGPPPASSENQWSKVVGAGPSRGLVRVEASSELACAR